MIEKLKRWLATIDKEWEGPQGMNHLAASRQYRRSRMTAEIFD